MYGLKYLRLRSRLGFGTEIWDLDLGPGFGTWIGNLDLVLDLDLTIVFMLSCFPFLVDLICVTPLLFSISTMRCTTTKVHR